MLDGTEKTYSTGELAELCGVSVRTVQYYDERGLLPPTSLTGGGRRVYTDDDAARLRRILLLKSLGLRLADIRGILSSEVSTQVMRDILVEQDRLLEAEVDERVSARARIATMIEALDRTGELPEDDTLETNPLISPTSWWASELRWFYLVLIIVGLILDVAEIVSLAVWIATGNWVPFAIVMPCVLCAGGALMVLYRARVAYLCPHCRETFVPEAKDWFFANHTPTTRKVTCTNCGKKDWCAEVAR